MQNIMLVISLRLSLLLGKMLVHIVLVSAHEAQILAANP